MTPIALYVPVAGDMINDSGCVVTKGLEVAVVLEPQMGNVSRAIWWSCDGYSFAIWSVHIQM